MSMVGKVLRGRYQIISKLGEGAFGETFLAINNDQPNNIGSSANLMEN